MKQVCARGKGTHARKEKNEIGMCQRRETTCERGEIMDQVCVRGVKIHAKKEKR